MTYNNIIDLFREFASQHTQINSFGYGQISSINQIENIEYPLLFVSPKDSSINFNNLDLSLNILLMDKLKDGLENEQEIHSDTLSVISDLKVWLGNSASDYFNVEDQSPVYPFTERFGDNLGGWTFSCKLNVEWDWNNCTIPGVSNQFFDGNGNVIVTNYTDLLQYYMPLTGGTFSGCIDGPCADFDLYSSGGTPLTTIIQNIASQYSGGSSSQTFSAGTNLILLTSTTNPNVVYKLSDGINLQFGISGGSFFQTSVNPNQFLGESYFNNDVHISAPNVLSAQEAELVNIYNTALTSNNAFIQSLTADTIYSLTSDTNYITVNNYLTAPVGYIDQFQSYQGGFQYDLSATTYYSGSTPLESVIYNIAANATVISGQTFSAGTNLTLFTSTTNPNVTYQLNTTLVDILALYSLNIYNYQDINNQGNINNAGKLTTTEAEMINLSATTAIYSGANFTSLETIIYNIATGSSVDNTAQLATKADLSGATFTGLIFSPTANTTYLKVNTLSANTTNPERAIIYDGVVNGYSNVLVGIASASTYAQLNIQNLSSASGASSDIIATANNGSESTNFVDLGINSSGFNSGNVGAANDGYVYGAANDFYVGNTTRNKKVGIFVGASSATTVDFTSGKTTFNQPVSAVTITASTYYSGTSLLQSYFPYDHSAFRFRGSANDRYHTTTKIGFSFSNIALTANRLYAFPLIIGENINIDRIGISVQATSSGSTSAARLGLYNSNSNHLPSTLIADFGTITTSATTNLTSISISQNLTPGLYFIGLVSNSTDTLRGIPTTALDGIVGYGSNPTLGMAGYIYQAYNYAALPANFTGSTYAVAVAPAVFYRIN